MATWVLFLWPRQLWASFTSPRFGFVPGKALAVATVVSPAAGSRRPDVNGTRHTGRGLQTSLGLAAPGRALMQPSEVGGIPSLLMGKLRPKECGTGLPW